MIISWNHCVTKTTYIFKTSEFREYKKNCLLINHPLYTPIQRRFVLLYSVAVRSKLVCCAAILYCNARLYRSFCLWCCVYSFCLVFALVCKPRFSRLTLYMVRFVVVFFFYISFIRFSVLLHIHYGFSFCAFDFSLLYFACFAGVYRLKTVYAPNTSAYRYKFNNWESFKRHRCKNETHNRTTT